MRYRIAQGQVRHLLATDPPLRRHENKRNTLIEFGLRNSL